ncbi:MAG TPA: YCF48-related protein [Puia sp.]|nr:YCF48-related protein [Puia sp.]
MRKTSPILLLWLFYWLPSSGQQQWKWLNPQPSGGAGLSIVFTDSQTGFILNSDGQLLKTVDQGGHWQSTAGDFSNATCMSIADSTGVIAGYNGLLYISSDNGNSWSRQNTGLVEPPNLISIVSRDTFFLGGNYNYRGFIYMTTDRGKTFTKIASDVYNGVSSMAFLDSKLGFIGGSQSVVLRTTDGGLTWQQTLSSNTGPSGIQAIQFVDKNTGYASREYNDILVTHDGGLTWVAANAYEGTSTLAAPSSQVAYAAGADGFMEKTVDGGASWNPVTIPDAGNDRSDINALCFLSENTGFTVGLLGRILKTTDGGTTWNAYSPTDVPVTAVSFPTADTGYFTTWNNVYKTTDSGLTWATLPLTVGTDYASSARFEQAQFSSPDTGFLVSSSYAKVFNTTDGGKNWTQQNPAPYGYDIVPGISFVNKTTGYMALEETGACCSGMIVKTTDGGKAWSPVWGSEYNGEIFNKIFFADASTAFAIRSYEVWKSTDSAKTWTQLNIPNNYPSSYNDLWFTSKMKGYVAGESGAIYTTDDGGATWQFTNPLINTYVGDATINAIRFFNPQVGYVTGGNEFGPGNYGYIYKTIDSGRTWQQNYNHGGTVITFTPDSNVLIGGFGGMLLKSPVATWQIDSVMASYISYPCTQKLSASPGVVLGEADSLSFEVTSPDNRIEYINASPSSVVNSRITCTAPSDPDWIPGAAYTVRFRLFYKGGWKYSAPISITAAGVPKPVITRSGDVLWSSAVTGDQWYLNGVAIPGATDNGWSPRATGSYTVQSTQNGCTSPMSDSVLISGTVKAGLPEVVSDTACTEQFSATLQTISLSADSISFEVTAPDQTITEIAASPNSLNNASATETASSNKLAPGKTYSVKLKLWANGSYNYSDAASFTLPELPTPAITDSAGQLSSSFSGGNQWYLDGTAVPGATASRIVPQRSGNYTVQSIQGACITSMSQPVKIVTGNLGVVAYPNPVGDHLTLVNTQNRTLLVDIVSLGGNTLYSTKIEGYSTNITTSQLAPGQYVVYLVDAVTKEKKSFTFVKL